MLNLLPNIIKFFFVFYLCFYICLKTMKISLTRSTIIMSFTLSIVFATLTHILGIYFVEIKYTLPLLLIWLMVSIYTNKPHVAFVASTISFILSCIFHGVSSLLIALSTYIIFNGNLKLPYLLLAILSSILHTILVLSLFKVRRFKKGMHFIMNRSFIQFSTVLFLVFLTLWTYIQLQESYKFGALICTLLLAFLIYWWQAQITRSYRRSLELRELESLRTELVEKDILIQRLLKENDRLATITHRDNTLIATLTNSACNYLMTDYANPAVAIEVRDSLIANIRKLSDGRLFLPDDYNKKKARDFDTGFSLLDEMLHHMDEDAIEMDITFSVHMGVMPGDFVPRDISEMELVHLVDDLLKNAFKAARNPESRMVQLQFYKLGRHFVVEVSDNGIPFGIKSLVNMGIEKMTTYEDGSGIGLMDIWNTKEKYGATYHLEEYAAPSPFSKKISLTFDKKNRYSIRTWRKDEILQMSKRADLQVYGHEE